MLVTIKEFNSLIEAQLAKSLLEGNDIEAFIPDESMATIYSPAIASGFRLQVAESHAEKALEILESLDV